MNLNRGILIGIAFYFATFILGIIIAIIASKTITPTSANLTTLWAITIITTVLLTSLACLWYFNKAKRNALEGLKLGATFVIIGLALNVISFFILQSNPIESIKAYYSDYSSYIVLLLVLATCIFVGSKSHEAPKEEKPAKKSKRK